MTPFQVRRFYEDLEQPIRKRLTNSELVLANNSRLVKSPEPQAALRATVDDLLKVPHDGPGPGFRTIKEQFLILVTCRDEKEQVEMLRRFKDEGRQRYDGSSG